MKKIIEGREGILGMSKYFKRTRDDPMPYTVFTYIINEYFNELKDLLMEGYIVSLGKNMGNLYVRRIDVNPNNPPIDWKETNKVGERVYKLWEKYVFQLKWNRWIAKVKNKNMYVSRGVKSFHRKVYQRHLDDPSYYKRLIKSS